MSQYMYDVEGASVDDNNNDNVNNMINYGGEEIDHDNQDHHYHHQIDHDYMNTLHPGDDSLMSGSSADGGGIGSGSSPQLHSRNNVNDNANTNTYTLDSNNNNTSLTQQQQQHHYTTNNNTTPTPGRVVETGQEHTGRWTREEHESFLNGLKLYGKEWKRVAAKVKTRTVVQTRTHAQKYFQKLQKSGKITNGRISMGNDEYLDMSDFDNMHNNNNSDTKIKSSSSSKSNNNTPSISKSGGDIAATTAIHSSLLYGNTRQQTENDNIIDHKALTSPTINNSNIVPDPTMSRPKQNRRTSTATLSAAQVISTLSSSKQPILMISSGGSTYVPMASSSSMLLSAGGGGPLPPPPRHGFSTTTNSTIIDNNNNNNTIPNSSNSSSTAVTDNDWSITANNIGYSIGGRPSTTTTNVTNTTSIMKIIAPDPNSSMLKGFFPEPSPAATGKRKLDEIAAARMLAGVMGGVQKMQQQQHNNQQQHNQQQHNQQQHNQQQSQQQQNIMKPPPPLPIQSISATTIMKTEYDDETATPPPTPPPSQAIESLSTNNNSFSMKNAPILPFMGSGNRAMALTTSNANNNSIVKKGFSLQILNPESFGVTFDTKRIRNSNDGENSPVTPWDGQLKALVDEQIFQNDNLDDEILLEVEHNNNNNEVNTSKNNDISVKSSSNGEINDLQSLHPICDPQKSVGRSSLHQTVCDMNVDAIQNLINEYSDHCNAKLRRSDELGYCPLHSACALGMRLPTVIDGNDNNDNKINVKPKEIVRILLSAGADTNQIDKDGNLPLHWAARSGDSDIIEQLIIKNSPLDIKNNKGETALHWAMRIGNKGKNVIKVLLENGARANILDKNYKRPLDVACEGFLDIDGSIASIRTKVKNISTSSSSSSSSKQKVNKELKIALNLIADEKKDIRTYFLIRSAQSRTLVLHHPECLDHHTKAASDWEAPDRIRIIMKRILPSTDTTTGIIETSGIFPHEVTVTKDFDRASLELLSRVHSTEYLSFVNNLSKDLEKRVKENRSNNTSSDEQDSGTKTPPCMDVVPFTPMVQRSMIKLDDSDIKLGINSDTSFSAGSLRAARRAAGAVQHAVDCVLVGRNRNAFCVVRPPGHHAGINGLLDGGESCGFCIFNNVAAGALYAIQEDRLLCGRCAIVDIDVHHGNGTEEIVRKCHDPSKLFFFSIHLYDNEKKKKTAPNQFAYKFYPGTGCDDDIALNIINVPIIPLWKEQATAAPPKSHNTRNKARAAQETQDDSSETSTNQKIGSRHSDNASENGSSSHWGSSSPGGRNASASSGRMAYREAIRSRLLPSLRAFNPDLILISTGFDAVKGDVGNARHEGGGKEKMGIDLEPEDYAWTTRKITEIADICCQGRVVSVLEGGYGRTPKVKTGSAETDHSNLDRSLFGECAIRHLHALIDPYDVENRFPTG